jgi:flagellar hook protein FlgE
MSSSLFASVSALRAQQTLLDVVGNNLANVNTTGFKSQRVQFSDLVYQTLRPATTTVSSSVGGTDPLQVGLGVKVGSIDTNLTQGGLEATGNKFDLAIEGSGFFVVSNGLDTRYTRAGAFAVDASNYLVDPKTGYRVQRFGDIGEAEGFQVNNDPQIRIPFGTTVAPKSTSTITFNGNLSASAIGPLAETLTSTTPFTTGGLPAGAGTLLNNIDGGNGLYAPGDSIDITGTDAAGAAVSTSLAVNAGSTMTDLLNGITAAFGGGVGATATLDASGNIVLAANSTGPFTLDLSLADAVGNAGSIPWGSHGLLESTTGKDGDTIATAIQVYDDQGTPHTMTLTFQKQAANLWDLTASIPSSDGTMIDNLVQGIQFNDNGSFRQLVGPDDGDISFQITGLSVTQTIGFASGLTTGFDGLTQYGGTSTASASDQNGYAAGFLTDVSIGPDGVIDGVFTNGLSLPLAQLAIASFRNPGGLDRKGDNYFALSSNSGIPQVGTATSGDRGSVQSSVLEASNVDLALEFTRLIVGQRAFQVNARAITAANEVLQELGNIIR